MSKVNFVAPTAAALLRHVSNLLVRAGKERVDSDVVVMSLRDRAKLAVQNESFFIAQDDT